jgi:hypothetical protein
VSVLLFSLHNETIRITIEADFNSAGDLVVEGYDVGKTVEEYWGSSDYEYSFTVPSHELANMYQAAQIPPEPEKLLAYLQQHFNTNTCFSDLRNWLDKHNVYHEGFSWS